MPRIRVDLPIPFAPSRATRSPEARGHRHLVQHGVAAVSERCRLQLHHAGRGERSGSKNSKAKRLSTGTGATACIRSSALSRLWACRALLAL